MYRAQKTDFTCGIACILMIMDELSPNHNLEEEDIIEECNTTSDKGTHPNDIINFFNNKGFDAVYRENGTITELEKLKNEGYFIIMIISVDVPHCIVYRGHNNNHFFFDDPWYGENKSRIIRKFEKERQKYPLMRWEVEVESLKKYHPSINFSKIEEYKGKKQFIIIK